jgi:ABC-2 type transport system permease protein
MSAEVTIARLTLRQLLARRRGVAVILFALLPAVIAGLFSLRVDADAVGFMIDLHDNFVIRVVLPVVALIFGTGAFGAERDDGTAVYLFTKPVPRWRIALAKIVTAAIMTTVVVTASALLAGVVAFRGMGPDRVVVAFTVGAAVGGVLYAAVFVALGLLARRAILVGLVYVVLWEAFASQMFAGTRTLSIRQYVLAAVDRIATLDPAVFTAALSPGTALAMGTAVLVTAVAVTVLRLRSFEVT